MNEEYNTNQVSTSISSGAQPSVRQLMKRTMLIVMKRWIVFLVVFIAVIGAGLTFIIRKPPVYVSKATVMFERNSRSDMSSALMLNPVLDVVPPQEFFKSILNSILYRQRLAKALRGSGYEPPEKMTVEEAIFNNLEFTIDKNNAFADIISSESNGTSAYLMVEQALATFIERSKEIQREETQTTLEFLIQQLQVVGVKMEKLEREIQEFQKEHNIDPANAERGVWGELYDLQHELAVTEVAYSLEELNLTAYEERFNALAQESASDLSGKDAPQIQALKKETSTLQSQIDSVIHEASHPERLSALQKALTEKRSKLIASILDAENADPQLRSETRVLLESLISRRTESELKMVSLKNQMQFIEQQIQRFKNDHPDLLESALNYARLMRTQEVLKNTNNLLMEKQEEAQIQAASETGGLKVIDPPYKPEKPVNPQNEFYLIVSLILALIIGFGVCFTIDVFDDSIKEPEDVERLLGISVLGMIPFIKPPKNLIVNNNNHDNGYKPKHGEYRPRHLLISNLPPADPVVEAYRSLKTNISFSSPDSPVRSMVISSPKESEGKSLTTANLAIIYALSGVNTLVIDCDLRRPIQHRIFGIKQSPGLTDALFDAAKEEEYYQKTGIQNLTLVPVGTNTSNPADLLNSEKMKKFIMHSMNLYDLVLLDTPPITYAIDARILSTKTQGLLFIIHNESTSVESARTALNNLRQVGGKTIGCVVNRISSRSLYKSYYNYYDYSQSEAS